MTYGHDPAGGSWVFPGGEWQPPPRPTRRFDRRIVFVVCAALAVAVVVIVVLVVALSSSGSDSNAERSDERITGSMNEWVGAVCASGRGKSGGSLGMGNISSGMCLDTAESLQGSAPVLFGVFDSVEGMEYGFSIIRPDYFTAATDPDTGYVTAFWVLDHRYGYKPLEPLEQFGFKLKPGLA